METLRYTKQWYLTAVNRIMCIRHIQDCRWMHGQARVESVLQPIRMPMTRSIWQERITGCLKSEGTRLSRAGQLTQQLSFKEIRKWTQAEGKVLNIKRPERLYYLVRGSLLEKDIDFLRKFIF